MDAGKTMMIKGLTMIAMLLMASAVIAADSTGCIYGIILDANDCQPIIGAHVVLQNTKLMSQ